MQQAVRYFRISKVPDHERLEALLLFLEGDALNWFLWTEENMKVKSWSEFHLKVEARFNSVNLLTSHQRLLSLLQENSVAEYRTEFERLSNPAPGIQAIMQEQIFLKGLKP